MGFEAVFLSAWLLKKMQAILQNDFEEYNARPYQRYSITAILNILDFAEEDKVRQAARMVLDYAAAKFAVGSNQGRRIAPFRRRMDSLASEFYDFHQKAPRPFQQKLFDLDSGTDHMIAFMLLYAGQTQQLPGLPLIANRLGISTKLASRASTAQMVYAASSSYVPDPVVLDIAVDKSQPYFQHFRHDGVETYSSAPSFLITAGGIETKSANKFQVFGVLRIGYSGNDLGTAMPITLMPAAGIQQMKWTDLLRIEGPKNTHVVDGETYYSFDHNLCIWAGFACGINLIVPPNLSDCVSDGPNGSGWRFLDSTKCAAYAGGRKFYVVIYSRSCPSGTGGCNGEYGFFEAVDNPPDDFDTFKAKVLAANSKNPLVPPVSGPDTLGGYTTYNGQTVNFNCMSHQNDSDHWGIEAVNTLETNDLAKWDFAAGDLVTAKGDGLISIKRKGSTLELDFRKWDAPVRSPP
jgi:hypothetical protein